MKPILLFLVILVIPVTFASICELPSCKEVMQSNLTEQEKNLLVASILYEGELMPNHKFVEEWNLNLKINNPLDVIPESKDSIRNSWVEIVSITPSVIENNTLLSSGKGKIRTEYGYKLEIPTEILEGDCDTAYDLVEENSNLKIKLNNNILGYDKILSFDTDEDLNFKAELDISAKYKINHYKEHKYCCQSSETGCAGYCYTCDYSYSTYKTDSTTLEDQTSLKKAYLSHDFNITVKNSYHDTIKGNVYSDGDFELEFDNSYYRKTNYIYSAVFSPKPVLTIIANKHEQEKTKNININKGDFIIPKPENCTITIKNHFENDSFDCNLTYNIPDFKIKTDKLTYFEGDTIEVITNNNVLLNYSTQRNKGTSEFTAELNQNKITGKVDEVNKDIYIHVKEKDTYAKAVNISVFTGLNYLVFLFMKKFAGCLV